MQIEFDTENVYCEPTDVERYFQGLESNNGFTEDTTPTAKQVNRMIEEWSAYIDRQCGHSWRNNKVKDEIHDLSGQYNFWTGRPIKLGKRDIRTPLDPEQGDKLEIWGGDQWEDWVADTGREQGRDGDFWFDAGSGMLYIYRRIVWQNKAVIRISYRYGKNQVDPQIRQACAKLAAADIIMTDQYTMNVPGTDAAPASERAAEQLKEDAERIIQERKELQWGEPF